MGRRSPRRDSVHAEGGPRRPYVGALYGDENRNVADEARTATMGMHHEGPALTIEEPLRDTLTSISSACACRAASGDEPQNAVRVPLHFRFREAAERGRDYDLRTLLDGTFVTRDSAVAVTFVDDHDSQPGQALASPIADWFKPIAYAFILLRSEGYRCVFHGDYFGDDQKLLGHRVVIDAMLEARARFGRSLVDSRRSRRCLRWAARRIGAQSTTEAPRQRSM